MEADKLLSSGHESYSTPEHSAQPPTDDFDHDGGLLPASYGSLGTTNRSSLLQSTSRCSPSLNDEPQSGRRQPAGIFGSTSSLSTLQRNHQPSESSRSTASSASPQTLFLPRRQSTSSLRRHISSSSISSLTQQQPVTFPNDLHRTAHTVGMHAFGIAALDVWEWEAGRLVHAHVWVHPTLLQEDNDAMARILDPSHPSYAIPVPQVPGAGLAGYFWSLGVSTASSSSAASTNHTTPYQPQSSHAATLIWRDVQAILSDPFQPPYQRMRVLEQAGLGKATGVPFDILGQRGVVVYMARTTTNETLLTAPSNVAYLRLAAQSIGAAAALVRPTQAVEQARERRTARTRRRVVAKLNSVSAFVSLRRSLSNKSLSSSSLSSSSTSLSSLAPQQRAASPEMPKGSKHQKPVETSSIESHIRSSLQQAKDNLVRLQVFVKQRIEFVAEKSHGSNLKPPPPAPLLNSIWTFCGVFLTLLTLVVLSKLLQTITGESIVLAPFGALLTLQFSLTAAPASQPRNILYGQLIAMATALATQHVFPPSTNNLFVLPFATAITIGAMTKLGCSHPPAAAALVALFSQPNAFSIGTVLCLLAGNVVAVLLSIGINNLSEQRQYPVYWHMGGGLLGDRESGCWWSLVWQESVTWWNQHLTGSHGDDTHPFDDEEYVSEVDYREYKSLQRVESLEGMTRSTSVLSVSMGSSS